MKSKIVLLLIFIVIATTKTNAQAEAESNTVKILERSPAAPNTASLGKYFDVPVTLSTGVADISIPLYTIKSGNITIPITLSYHASGNKVNAPASWVGFGWDLSNPGVITKQVNGLDDFYSETHYVVGVGHASRSNYFNPDYTIDNALLSFNSMTEVIDSMHSVSYGPGHTMDLYKLFGRIIQNYYDGEADEYHYSTPEDGGTIFYNQQTASFQMDKLNGWNSIYGSDDWTLKSKSGIHYFFDAREETLSPVLAGNYSSNMFYTSAWYLTNIADHVNGRTVDISYDASGRKYYGNGVSIVENWKLGGVASYNGGGLTSSLRYGRELNVNTIDFKEGRVEFIKDTAGRIDGGINALKKILVYDDANVLKKQFNFEYMYVGPLVTSTRLYLKSVQEVNFLDGTTTESKPYLFHYDTTIALPVRFSYAQDIWGYYNGKTGNTTTIPTEWETQVQGLPAFANRRIDSNYTKAGMLKQIVYPTGGSLNFTFENNQDETDSLVGGLRIKRIVNYDSVANKKITTEYRYNDNSGHSTGIIQYKPKFNYSLAMGSMLEPNVRVSGEPIFPLFGNQGSPVTYARVEKIEIADTVETKSRYYFYNNLNGLSVPDPLFDVNDIGVPFPKLPNVMRFSNLHYATEVFKRENGQYLPVQTESMGYTTLNQFKNYIWNVQAAWNAGFGVWVEDPSNDPYSNGMSFYPAINSYKLIQESVVNDVSTTNIYNGSDILSQTTYKKFDTTNGNLKKLTTVVSNGDTLRTYFSYSCDFLNTSSSDPINDEIDILLNANILDAPVEVISTRKEAGGSEYVTDANLYLYKDGKLQKHLKIYKTDFLLSSLTPAYNNSGGFYYDSDYETESEILSFTPYKNPMEIAFRTKTQALIWDKDNVMAIAENADSSSVAATSFETSAKGRWVYSGSASLHPNARTGVKGYSLAGGDISRSGINSGETYIVTYWKKDSAGTITVNSGSGSLLAIKNGWKLYSHEITGASSLTITGTAYIDELRLHPKTGTMKTFTYNPLIGITTQCDGANRIVYYEYDGFGRLKLLKDEEGKILKRIDYKYQGAYQD